MSSIFDKKENKIKCQKFTSEEMVNKLLDLAGFSHDLMGKKILEYSFGSGNILVKIVQKYIQVAKKDGFDPIVISKGLSTDIFGIELDEELFDRCVKRLDSVVESYSLPSVKWSLFCEDALRWKAEIKFDYVIGNPPYISYKQIDDDTKTFIRENYSVCRYGKFDYCYAFLEKGISLLSETGKMVQLVPENIYKNVFAQNLRDLLLEHIVEIHEYPEQNKFRSTLTSSSIFLYDRANSNDVVIYKNETANLTRTIPKVALLGKWVFCHTPNMHGKEILFGDRFRASISVATQLNSAFVISESDLTKYEKEVIKPAASPRKMRKKEKEFIIFPYRISKGIVKHIDETSFLSQYPLVSNHLKVFYDKLLLRDADTQAKWYEYGRSQALSHINQKKLLISTIVTNKVELYELDACCIPYSGIFITAKEGFSIEEAKMVLLSDEFLKYVLSIGISINGKSKRITCRDINNYRYLENK